MLSIYRTDEKMDKVHPLRSGCKSGENLESGCEKEVSGEFAVRSVFTIGIKAKILSD